MKDKVLALAEELDGVSFKENCDQCLACGTALCRGDMECAESVHKACAKRLREIVEHDACEDTTVSAYDLLSEEDRKALAWVREMGGVDEVERRLMPDGVEWPKVDGKLVDFGAGYEPSLGVLKAFVIYNNGACEVMSHDGIIKNVTEIHAVKPKVLDADGVPIREGDTVWLTGESEYSWTVTDVSERHVGGYCNEDGSSLDMHSKSLTHAKPEQPDTWERLEHDAEKTVCEYFGANYDCANCPLESARCAEEVKKDIIRRAKKLAERGER